MTRCTEVTASCGIEMGISVETIHGTTAEKKIIDETETTAMTNLTTNADSTTSNAGRNISAIPSALAFATNIGSGNCNTHVNG